MTAKPTVLVTGATGRVGGQVVAQLVAAGIGVRALTRDPASAARRLPAEADVVGGDLTRPASLAGALDEISAVFLVFPSVTGDAAAAELVAILAKGAPRIVYLSAHGVPDEPDPHAEPDGGILASHAHLEGLISAAATDYTFLRASGFATNTLGWAEQIRGSDVLRWFHPEAKRALVHEADLAAVGVRALTADTHGRHTYHLTGPEQLTQAQQLQAIGDAVGRSLRFEEVDPDAAEQLFPGMPPAVVAGIVAAHGAMITHPEPVTDTIERLIGRPALSFAQWARDHAADFTASG